MLIFFSSQLRQSLLTAIAKSLAALDGFNLCTVHYLSSYEKIWVWQNQDSNPEPLGAKHLSYPLCHAAPTQWWRLFASGYLVLVNFC